MVTLNLLFPVFLARSEAKLTRKLRGHFVMAIQYEHASKLHAVLNISCKINKM